MGVFIKKKEMPESCCECAYPIEKYGICSITEGGCDWSHSRPPHCPLVEIPDELVEAWQEYIKKAETIGKVKAVNVPKGEMT